DKIVDVLVRERDVAVHDVRPRRGVLVGHAEANRERHARRDAPLDLILRQTIAAPVVAERLSALLRVLAPLLELRRRTEAAIRSAALEQPARIRLVALEVRALVDDLLVPRQAEPLESLEDRARALFRAARLVGVLDTEEELPAVVLHVQPVEQRGARAAYVEVAGGTGGKSETIRHRGVRREVGGGSRKFR